MSSKPVFVTDSRLLHHPLPRPVLRGASQILYKAWPAQNATANSIHFVCPTPQEGDEIDRSIQICCPCRVTTTAVWDITQNGQYLGEPNKFGIRSYPIHKATERLDVNLNNQSFTINIGEIMSAMEHFNTSRKLKLLEYSKTSTYGTCQSQKFSDMTLGIRSGLSCFQDSLSGIAPQNFPFKTWINDPANAGNDYTATYAVDFVSTENLYLSPLYWGDSENNYNCFAGIKTLDVRFQFQGTNPGFRMIAIDNTNALFADRGGTITGSLQVKFAPADEFPYSDQEPKLLVQYLRPQIPRSLKEPLFYPYYHIDTYKYPHSTTVAASAAATLTFRDILIHKLPSKIFIWARKPDATFNADPFTPDCFTSIEGATLFWNNRTVLGEAHKGQLYDMCVKNGLQYEYAQWSGYGLNKNENVLGNFGSTSAQFGGTGAVLCIDPMDLGLDDHITLNPNVAIPLGIQLNIKNISADTITPQLHLAILYDGIMKLEDGVVTTQLGIDDTKLEPSDIKFAAPRKLGSYQGEYKIDIPTLIRTTLNRNTENDPLRLNN